MTIVENSIYAGLENDALEISKIKQDLVALRSEIEIQEQEEFTNPSVDINENQSSSQRTNSANKHSASKQSLRHRTTGNFAQF